MKLKQVARQPAVQSVLAWLIGSYLAFTHATIRWRIENRAAADEAALAPEGVVALFWHGRIALAPACLPVLNHKQTRVLISSSPDGELITRAIARLGLKAIRGSSTRDSRKDRRSVQAFREAISFIDEGGVVVVTPDGPRGPAQEMPAGPLALARTRTSPVFLFGLAARPTFTLGTWDRLRVPLPFGRGCVVFDGPVWAERGISSEAAEVVRLDWQQRLTAAQSRAEAILAGA